MLYHIHVIKECIIDILDVVDSSISYIPNKSVTNTMTANHIVSDMAY
jgi:hypothetical protein